MICLALLLAASTRAEPVTQVWIRASSPGAAMLETMPEVHSVETGARELRVRSSGVSRIYWGAVQRRPAHAEFAQRFEFVIPREAPRKKPAALARQGDLLGVFTNGVPIYSAFAGDSHSGARLWHYDRVAGQPQAAVVANLAADGNRHSPIVGYAFNGSPIYGPWAMAGGQFRRMRSSYRLRALAARDRWPNGLALTPGQEGPRVDARAPLGTFHEDYEYVPGSGDLDEFNGRTVQTPEYPEGVYAYFLTVDDEGQLAFPYLFGEPVEQGRWTQTDFSWDGESLHWRLRDERGGAIERLESVHEKPMHVMLVREDLTGFTHEHPELTASGDYRLSYRFPRAGRYHVYADFTPPGAPRQLDHRVIEVNAAASTVPAAKVTMPADRWKAPAQLVSGRDLDFAFRAGAEALEPFLGAWGHFVLIDENHEIFVHVHPKESGPRPSVETHAHATNGPAPEWLEFTLHFPKPGRYRLWAQSQRSGTVETREIDLDVAAGDRRPSELRIPAGAIRVDVNHRGFEPARITAPSDVGGKVTLAFVRGQDAGCGQRVVFPDLHMERDLPVGEAALVQVPLAPGQELRFTCGMGMYRGAVKALR